MRKRCSIKHLFMTLMRKDFDLMSGMVNELILLERMGDPDEFVCAKPIDLFPSFRAFWCRMGRLELNGVWVSGPQGIAYEDMEMRDVVSAFKEFLVEPDINYVCEPSFGRLHIEWDTGNVDFSIKDFFPCEHEQLVRLLDVIKLDKVNRQDHIIRLRLSFMKQILLSEYRISEARNHYLQEYSLWKGDEIKIQTGLFPNGDPVDKEHMAWIKHELEYHAPRMLNYKAIIDHHTGVRDWLLKHIGELK